MKLNFNMISLVWIVQQKYKKLNNPIQCSKSIYSNFILLFVRNKKKVEFFCPSLSFLFLIDCVCVISVLLCFSFNNFKFALKRN